MHFQKNQTIEGDMQNNQDHAKEHQNHNYEYDKSKSDYIQTLNFLHDLKKDVSDLKKDFRNMMQIVTTNQVPKQKEYYSVKEFAEIIDRAEFTVRGYCNNKRINAEKKDSGRGKSNEWKISYEELNHYQNHGLRPR